MMQKGDPDWLRITVKADTETIYQLLRGAQAILNNIVNSPIDEETAYGLLDMALVRLIELQVAIEPEETEQPAVVQQ